MSKSLLRDSSDPFRIVAVVSSPLGCYEPATTVYLSTRYNADNSIKESYLDDIYSDLVGDKYPSRLSTAWLLARSEGPCSYLNEHKLTMTVLLLDKRIHPVYM